MKSLTQKEVNNFLYGIFLAGCRITIQQSQIKNGFDDLEVYKKTLYYGGINAFLGYMLPENNRELIFDNILEIGLPISQENNNFLEQFSQSYLGGKKSQQENKKTADLRLLSQNTLPKLVKNNFSLS